MIKVNETELDEETILREMQYHNAETQREAMIKASETLIIGELLRQRAKSLDIQVDVDEQNQALYEDEHLQKLVDAEVDMPFASVEDCKNYFQQNQDKFTTSPLVSVRHILLAEAPEDDLARVEARNHAKNLISMLTGDPEKFASLAANYSKCHSAKEGGHLGQISKGQTVAEFERQVFRCEPGLVPTPIESRYGIHVVMVDRFEPGKPLTFEMVQEKIETYLNEKVRRKAIAQYIEQLIGQADIEGFDFSVSESPLVQ